MKVVSDFYAYCQERGYDPEMICSGSRYQELVEKRVIIAKYLYALGHNYSDIAHAMDRDPSTIRYLIIDEWREEKNRRSREYMRAL